MSEPQTRWQRRGASDVLVAGGAAGLLALALDQLLVQVTSGFLVPIRARHLGFYLLTGLVAAMLLHFACRWTRAHQLTVPASIGLSSALLYLVPVSERIVYSTGFLPTWASAAVVLAITGAYLAWLYVGAVLSASAGWTGLATAIAVATGLAVNRNIFDEPLAPATLLADAAILTTAGAAVLLLGPRGRRAQTAGAAAAFVFAAAAGWLLHPEPTAPAPATEQTTDSPNLVLLVIDTLREDVFADVVANTAEGQSFRRALGPAVWFRNAIAASPWTVPSMGSILTGRYPREHGLYAPEGLNHGRPLTTLSARVPTLAQALGLTGYRTEALVTNPLLHPVTGIARGIEHYELLTGPVVKLPLLGAVERQGWLPKEHYQQASSVRRRLGRRLAKMEHDPRPFFLWLHLMDPHAPLLEHAGLRLEQNAPDGELESAYRREVRFTLAEVAAMIEQIDAAASRPTAIVLLSDHGEMFPSDRHDNGLAKSGRRPKVYGHGHAFYDELVRVPLVVRPVPGLDTEHHVDDLVSHVDLAHSVAEMLALPGLLDADGQLVDRVSFAPLLLGQAITTPRAGALSGAGQLGKGQRSVHTGGTKLIQYGPGGRVELFDLVSDPGERDDLAVTRPSLRHRLESLLLTLHAQQLPPPEPAAGDGSADLKDRLRTLGYVP